MARTYVLLIASVMLAVASPRGQSGHGGDEHVAFRVDDSRVIAHLFTRDFGPPQVREGLSRGPIARFGYEHFEPPEHWRPLPTDIRAGDRWWVHTAPGTVVRATVERMVGGYTGCQESIGALLKVVPDDVEPFRAARAHYFVAERSDDEPIRERSTPVASLGSHPLPPAIRRDLESSLARLLARELPRVQAERAPSLQRMLKGDNEALARERLKVEDAMRRGDWRMKYDVQAFQLAPNGGTTYFVRAEWLVGMLQGFVATLWARDGRPLEVLETDVRPARWLGSSLFWRGLVPTHLGLILNVLDRDGDHWGEVLVSHEGYESRSIRLLEYSPTGFQPTGVEHSGGC